jgi:hypothetical protein
MGSPTWNERLDVLLQQIALAGSARAQVVPPEPGGPPLPRVSVLIPCHNYARYLPRCVASAIEQQGVDVDVLIVDDASTDDSAEVGTRLARADSRIRVIAHEQNQGHIATFNEGLFALEGNYLTLVSADDVLTPGSLARAARLMEANPDVGFVYGYGVEFSSDPPPPARTRVRTWTIWPGREWIRDRCRTGRNPVRSPTALVRADVQHEVGGYRADLPYSADFEMWIRLAAVADVGLLGGVDQAFYRVHAESMTRSVFAGALTDLEERLRTFDLFFDAWGARIADSETLRATARRTLAREALQDCINAYANRYVDDARIAAQLDFAARAWPAVHTLPEWRALQRRRTVGPRWAPLVPPFYLRGRARSLRWRFFEQRARWSGSAG